MWESGVRSQNGSGVRAEHTADFFRCGGQFGSVSITEILRQDQIVAALLQRSLRQVHEAGLVQSAAPPESLGDVGRNRYCRPPHLRRQAISFLSREASRESVDGQYELMRFAPHQDRKSTRLNSSHEWISYAV